MKIKNKIMKAYLSLLVVLINGCSLPDGGECVYNTTKSYAKVKEIKEKHILVSYPEYEEKIDYLFPVHKGEILPADFIERVKGSCPLVGYSINGKSYFGIKSTSISFSDDGKGIIEQEADTKVMQVAKYFLALQKDYPNARLVLYSHASLGSQEYRYNKALNWYGNIVKTRLSKNSVDKEFILVIFNDGKSIIDFAKPFPRERVNFAVTFL